MHPSLRFAALVVGLLLAVPAHAQWTDGQNAFRVLGQPNYTSNTANNGGLSASTLSSPNDVCVDVANSKLYVVDTANNRVLRYVYPTTADQQAAEAVLGQADLTSSTAAITQSGMDTPRGCAVDGGRLWVVDFNNSRILRFDAAASKSNGANADGVLGQSDFTSSGVGTTQSTLRLPYGATVDGSGTLWVADEGNNRVLRYDNASSKSNGANADGVLGQADFTSNGTATTQSGMNSPLDVAVDGAGALFVSDFSNNRVLRYDNAASKGNGGTADGVLGQSNFTAFGGTISQSGMNGPGGLAIDANNRLYVADQTNNRVVTFNSASGKANGGNADNVLGQANFTSNSSATTQGGMSLSSKSGLDVDSTNDHLWLADETNERATGYQASSSLPVELVAFTASAVAPDVVLTWNTASETNNAGFFVERKAKSVERWKEAAWVAGHGTTTEVRSYSHTVTDLAPGRYAFRLRQVDYDGAFAHSAQVEVTVGVNGTFDLRLVGANPVAERAAFRLTVPTAQAVTAEVLDVLGRRVALLHDGAVAADASLGLAWDASAAAPGVYLVRVTGERFAETRRIVVQR